MPDIWDQAAEQAASPKPAGDIWDQAAAGAPKPESFMRGVARNLNPLPMLKSIGGAIKDASTPTSLGEAAAGAATPGGPLAYEFAKRVLPSVLQSHEEQIKKARDAYQKGSYTEAAGHLMGAAVPFVGPLAAHAGEEIGGTEPTYDKYGNIVTPEKPPNPAGGLGEAAGLLAPAAVAPLAKGAVRAAADSSVPETLRESAETQYGRVLAPTTKGNKYLTSEKVAPGLIQRGVTATTMKGLAAKTASQVQALGQKLGDAYEGLPDDAAIPLSDVEGRIDQAVKDSLTAGGTSASPMTDSAITLANDLKSRLRSVAVPAKPEAGQVRGLLEPSPLVTEPPADTSAVTSVEPARGVARIPKGKPGAGKMFRYYTEEAREPITPDEVLPPEHYSAPTGAQPATATGPQTTGAPPASDLMVRVGDARRFRQIWDDIAAAAGRYQGADLADYAKGSVHGFSADAIRSVLAQNYPNIADINREYTFWKNADKVVQDTLLRRQGQAKPLGVKMANVAGTGAGMMVGGIHGAIMGREAMGMLESTITSPAWQTVSAVLKDRLADAIASGNKTSIGLYTKIALRAVQSLESANAEKPPAPLAVGTSPQ